MKRSDFDSSVWLAIKAEVESRLEEHCKALERHDMTPETTQLTRGRISELRHLLALPERVAPATARRPAAWPRDSFDPDAGL